MLELHDRRKCQIQALSLTGSFDSRNMMNIKKYILATLGTGGHHIILDFSRVMEIDSSSLNEFFLWYHTKKSQQIQISVIKPSPYLRYHEDWTHLAEIVSIYKSLQEALDHIGDLE